MSARRPAEPPKRHRAWPFFAAAVALLVLAAVVGLPAPFSGLTAMGCVAAFIAGCARIIRHVDPEGTNPAHRAGMGGLGGGF